MVRSLQPSPERLADSSKLNSIKILENSYWRETLLRIQRLSMDTVDVDLLNKKPEVEINEVGISESREECPLTLDTLLGIFYKNHSHKPIIAAKKSKDESPDEIIGSTEFE